MKIVLEQKTGLDLIPFDNEVMDRALIATPIVYDGRIDGERACVIGVIPPTLMSDRVYIWLHTMPMAERHKFVVARTSQIFIQDLLSEWPLIVGHCIAGDDRAVRWMKWLGAVFGPPDGKKLPFSIRRK